MFSEIFDLGYELTLLPINSSECAMGDSIRFIARLDKINDQVSRNVFKLGFAIGKIQLYSLKEIMNEERKKTYELVQSLIRDLKIKNSLFQIVEKWLADFDMIDFFIPMKEGEVLELKSKIERVLIKME